MLSKETPIHLQEVWSTRSGTIHFKQNARRRGSSAARISALLSCRGVFLLTITTAFLIPQLLFAAVQINEVMASNGSTIADQDGDFEDWIELFNDGSAAVDLTGWGLSDSYQSPFKWTFPEGAVINAGQYLLIWASGKDRPLHANFSISSSGEEVLLTRPDGTRADELPPTVLPRDISIGRVEGEGSTWFFFNEPTPGGPNITEAATSILPAPQFSHAGGFYTNAFWLSLSHPEPDAYILFTLDGSAPNPDNLNGSTYGYKNRFPRNIGDTDPGTMLYRETRSHLYVDPLFIQDRSPEPYEISAINTEFTTSTHLPSANPFKGTVVRARAYRPGSLPGPIITHTFFVSSNMTSRYTLPVVSVSTDESNLFDYEDGIYTPGQLTVQWRLANPDIIFNPSRPANYRERGPLWERDAHIEMFSPDGTQILSHEAGIRIHGGWSRATRLKSLRLYARSFFGGGESFEGDLFPGLMRTSQPEQPLTSFRRLLLRNSGNDWATTYFRDAFMQELAAPLKLDSQAYRPVIHFINGEFWGMINIRERLDAYYLESHYGIAPEEAAFLTAARASTPIAEDRQHFMEVVEYAEDNDFSDPEHYQWIETRVDLDNLIRYYAFQVYINNRDWPYGNIDWWRKRTDSYIPDAPMGHDGRWRWMLYDTDFGFGGFGNHTVNSLDRVVHLTPGHYGIELVAQSTVNDLFRSLIFKHEGFRHSFINTLADGMNSYLKPDHVRSLITAFSDQIAPHRAEHNQRWRTSLGLSSLETFAGQRPAAMRTHVLDVFDLPGTYELEVINHMQQSGSVQINSLFLTPGLEGLADPMTPYPWTGIYFRTVPIILRAHPEEGHRFAGWRLNEDPDTLDLHNEISLTLEEDTTIEVLFEPIPLTELPPTSLFLIAGESPFDLNLTKAYIDPAGDLLSFTATSSVPHVVALEINEDILQISPQQQGESWITLQGADGTNPVVTAAFRVLVYPAAHPLAAAPFTFTEWFPSQPANTYPDHMLFLQGQNDDSALDSDLLHAYHIPPLDGALPQDSDFPYAALNRTRINGLGEEGIAFINTGRGRDLGGALLALDTREVTEAPVSWLAGTLLENSREYALRLQYRVGTTGPFLDVLDADEQPVEYRRQSDGHMQPLPPVMLPEEALGQEYVQLLWRYYHVSGESGPRAQLRLDDILVGNAAPNPASHLVFTSPLRSSWQSGQTLLPFTLHALNEQGVLDPDFAAPVTVSVSGDGSASGTTTVAAELGVAVFTNVTIHGAGEYVVTAQAEYLQAATSAPIRVVSVSGLHVPRYIQGDQPDNNDRVPFVYRARLEGLVPDATYRYGNRVVTASDAWDQNGAGNMIFVTGSNTDWIRNTSAPLFGADDLGSHHWIFTTDEEGTYEGWFVTEPSGNARFTPGNTLYMRILLNDGIGGEQEEHFLTVTNPVSVIRFGTTEEDGSGITGSTAGPIRNIVYLYDHTAGDGRPVAGVPVERTGSHLDSRYATFYEHLLPQAWGAMIPNHLTGGVQRVETRTLAANEPLLASVFDYGLPGTRDATAGSTAVLVEVRPAPTSFAAWQAIHFDTTELADAAISGALADPDESGIPNLLRHALGLQRHEAVEQALPRGQTSSTHGEFVHRRLIGSAAVLSYVPEFSHDLNLNSWESATNGSLHLISITPLGDGAVEEVLYRLDDSILDAPVYLRLKVTKP